MSEMFGVWSPLGSVTGWPTARGLPLSESLQVMVAFPDASVVTSDKVMTRELVEKGHDRARCAKDAGHVCILDGEILRGQICHRPGGLCHPHFGVDPVSDLHAAKIGDEHERQDGRKLDGRDASAIPVEVLNARKRARSDSHGFH